MRRPQRMVVQAYILVQTNVGKAAEVANAIGAIQGVTLAEDVTGPYDVIVRAEASSVDELGKLVLATVQHVPGITRTLTCPVVPAAPLGAGPAARVRRRVGPHRRGRGRPAAAPPGRGRAHESRRHRRR